MASAPVVTISKLEGAERTQYGQAQKQQEKEQIPGRTARAKPFVYDTICIAIKTDTEGIAKAKAKAEAAATDSQGWGEGSADHASNDGNDGKENEKSNDNGKGKAAVQDTPAGEGNKDIGDGQDAVTSMQHCILAYPDPDAVADPKAAVRADKADKKAFKDFLNESATLFERQSRQYEHNMKLQGKNAGPSMWKEKTPFQPSFRVELVVDYDSKFRPELQFKLMEKYQGPDGKEVFHKRYFSINSHNIERDEDSKIGDFCSLKKITEIADISDDTFPDIDKKQVQQALAAGVWELKIKGRGWCDRVNYSGFRMHVESEPNSFAYNAEIFCKLLEQPYELDVLLYQAPTELEQALKAIEYYIPRKPTGLWYKGGTRHPIIQKGEMIPNELRPTYHLPAQMTYGSGEECYTVEGFGAILDVEYCESLTNVACVVDCRLITYAGGRGTQMVALLDLSTMKDRDGKDRESSSTLKNLHSQLASLKAGASLTASFLALNPQGLERLDWTAKVTEHISAAGPDDLIIRVNSSKDQETKQHRVIDLSPVETSIVDIQELGPLSEAIEALRSKTPCKVEIRQVAIDAKSYGNAIRQTDCMKRRFVGDNTANGGKDDVYIPGDFEVICNGVRFDTVQRHDLYAGIDEQILEDCAQKHFAGRPDQQAAMDLMRKAPGGIVLIHGSAGTGKSHAGIALLQPIVQDARQKQQPVKILIASPINANADAMAIRCKTDDKQKVIRLFSKGTERKVADLQLPHIAKTGSLDEAAFKEEITAVEAKQLYSAMELLENLQEESKRVLYRIKDKRLNTDNIEDSLGVALLMACGLHDSTVVVEDPVYSQFRRVYNTMKNALSRAKRHNNDKTQISEDLSKLFGESYIAAANQVISEADVLITTLANATSGRVQEFFKADYLMIEEGSKAESLQAMSLIAMNAQLKGTIIVGDVLQIAPQASAPLSYNAFARQVGMSLFTRLYICGMPHASLTLNQRSSPGITEFISEVFCGGKMFPAPAKLEQDDIEGSRTLRNEFMASFHKEFVGKDVLGVDVGDTVEERFGLTKSKTNRGTGKTLFELWERHFELHASTTAAAQYAMITPFTGQKRRLQYTMKSLIHDLQKKGEKFHGHDPNELKQVLITTVDKAQGDERAFVFFDFTAAEKVGFLHDPRRLFTGCSRAGTQLILIFDYEQLKKGNKSSTLRDLFDYLKEHNQFYVYKQSDAGKRDYAALLDVYGGIEKTAAEPEANVASGDDWGAPAANQANSTLSSEDAVQKNEQQAVDSDNIWGSAATEQANPTPCSDDADEKIEQTAANRSDQDIEHSPAFDAAHDTLAAVPETVDRPEPVEDQEQERGKVELVADEEKELGHTSGHDKEDSGVRHETKSDEDMVNREHAEDGRDEALSLCEDQPRLNSDRALFKDAIDGAITQVYRIAKTLSQKKDVVIEFSDQDAITDALTRFKHRGIDSVSDIESESARLDRRRLIKERTHQRLCDVVKAICGGTSRISKADHEDIDDIIEIFAAATEDLDDTASESDNDTQANKQTSSDRDIDDEDADNIEQNDDYSNPEYDASTAPPATTAVTNSLLEESAAATDDEHVSDADSGPLFKDGKLRFGSRAMANDPVTPAAGLPSTSTVVAPAPPITSEALHQDQPSTQVMTDKENDEADDHTVSTGTAATVTDVTPAPGGAPGLSTEGNAWLPGQAGGTSIW